MDIVAWWPNEQNPSLGSFIKDQVLSTAEQCDHHVLFLSFSKTDWYTVPQIEISSNNNEIGVHYIKVKSPLRRFGFHDFLVKTAYSKAFKYLSKKYGFIPDLAHVHVRSHLTKLALDLLIERKMLSVLSEHFSYYNRGINLLDAYERERELKDIKRQLNAQAIRRIMPVSEDLKNSLKEKFQIADKMEVIPNIANNVFLNTAQVSKNAFHFVSCANWDYPKDPLTMLNALQLIRKELPSEFHLDIIGDGPLLNEMKSFVGEHLTSLSITFHGYQTKTFIAEKLSKASGLLHPTTSENLPTIIIESLICGSPVLSMNINGIPEMITDVNGILVPAMEPEAFGQGLLTLLQLQFNYQSIAEAARLKYSGSVVALKLMGVYQDVLKRDRDTN